MQILTNFDFPIDKKRILKIIGCQLESSFYHKTAQQYDYFLEHIEEFVSPIGVYNFIDIPPSLKFEELANCSQVVLCFLTLGEKVSQKTKEYFGRNEFLEAMLLEVMADEILFKLSEQLFCKVFLDAKEKGWNLTVKIEPGTRNIPLDVQREIFENLHLEEMGISLNSSYMFRPIKSLAFFYGAGENISSINTGHDCARCSMKNCMFKIEKVQ